MEEIVMRPVESGTTEAERARAIQQYTWMRDTPAPDQFRLCRERMIDCMGKVIERAKARGWKVAIKNNQLILPYVKTVGTAAWGRIGLTIGPDSYNLCYIETGVISAVDFTFIDALGYTNQETKRWLTFEDAMEEIERLLQLYEGLEGVRLWSGMGQE